MDTTNPPILYTSRSAAINTQFCPRSRLYTYLWQGRGLSGKSLALPLHVGSCIHLGLQNLLDQKSPDESVGIALEYYWSEVKSHGLTLEDGINLDFAHQEQAALIEALLRAYALRVLPSLRARFHILETEKEDMFEL